MEMADDVPEDALNSQGIRSKRKVYRTVLVAQELSVAVRRPRVVDHDTHHRGGGRPLESQRRVQCGWGRRRGRQPANPEPGYRPLLDAAKGAAHDHPPLRVFA